MAGKDEGTKDGVEIKQPPETEGGIKVEETPGEIPPPLQEGEGEEAPPGAEEEAPPGKRIISKVPISPAVIKPLLRLEGNVLAQATGYPGWLYTEDEADAISTLISECGWEMDPRFQIVLSIGTLHAGKFMAMKIWEKTGRPGDLKKVSTTGEIEKKERPGEGTKA